MGGVDISYPTWSDSLACGCLVVYNTRMRSLVYQDTIDAEVSVPYIPGFLAYREMSVYRQLLSNLRTSHPECMPQVLLVDGQGRLHPRHFGSACALGLEVDIPTIGVGKNPFCGESFCRQVSSDSQSQTTSDSLLHHSSPYPIPQHGSPWPLSQHTPPDGIDVCLDTHPFKQHIAENLKNNRHTVSSANALNVDSHSP